MGHVRSCHAHMQTTNMQTTKQFSTGFHNRTNMFHNIFLYITDSHLKVLLCIRFNVFISFTNLKSINIKKKKRISPAMYIPQFFIYNPIVAKIGPKESLTYIRNTFLTLVYLKHFVIPRRQIYVPPSSWTYRNILAQLQTQTRAPPSTSWLYACVGQWCWNHLMVKLSQQRQRLRHGKWQTSSWRWEFELTSISSIST